MEKRRVYVHGFDIPRTLSCRSSPGVEYTNFLIHISGLFAHKSFSRQAIAYTMSYSICFPTYTGLLAIPATITLHTRIQELLAVALEPLGMKPAQI
jgi:hypothetical protein